MDRILSAFADAGVSCSVHFRHGLPARVETLRAKGIEVHDTPQSLAQVLPQVSAVIHHASLNTASAALVAGRPQLVIPRHLEQDLTAKALHESGVGCVLGGRLTMQNVGQSLRALTEDSSCAANAHALAEELYQRGAAESLDPVVESCLDLL